MKLTEIESKNPCNVRRTKREDGLIISTIKPSCLAWYGKFETALITNHGKENQLTSILEGYGTREEAVKGHEKYCNMSTYELLNFEYIGWGGLWKIKSY